MNDRGLRAHRQVFPTQQLDRLRMPFMNIFYGRYLIFQVPVDTPGLFPGSHLQLPKFLSQINVSPARKGKFDGLQDAFKSPLSLNWLYASPLDYRGDYGFFSRVRHRDRERVVFSRLRSVSSFLNRHSTDQLRPAFLRTVIL